MEDGRLHGHEVGWGVELHQLALVEDHDVVIVHDGVQPVGDGQDGGVLELSPDGLLDQVISLEVHSSRGFIQDEDLGLPEQGPGQTDELALPHWQILPTLSDLMLQPGLEGGDEEAEVAEDEINETNATTTADKRSEVNDYKMPRRKTTRRKKGRRQSIPYTQDLDE